MAKLYISEFSAVGQPTLNGQPQTPQEPCILDQTPITIGGSSVQSAAFNTATRFIRLHADAICSVAFGTNPTATGNSKRFAANTTEYLSVRPGDMVAVITNT